MSHVTIHGKTRLLAPALLLAALAACSGKDESTSSPSAKTAAGAAAAAAAPAAVVSEKVQSMDTEQLRDAASQALRDNRMYAPAGDNAVEYYLALRDKLPDDAAIKSALTDLQPYTLIAAEQSMAREDFTEAQRLVGMIEKMDPGAPALPRLQQGISNGIAQASQRSKDEAERAKADAENRAKQQVEQQRLAQQQAAQAAAALQIAAQQEEARKQNEQAEAERQAAARREADQRAQQQAAQAQAQAVARQQAAPPTLRPVSTPAPRFPPEALRAGTAGEVLIEITVGTDGSVTNARVLRATPQRVFDREALAAVKRWRFEPVSAPVTTRRTLAFTPGN